MRIFGFCLAILNLLMCGVGVALYVEQGSPDVAGGSVILFGMFLFIISELGRD